MNSGDTSGNGHSTFPQISSDGNGHVYVAWKDRRNGSNDIYFNYFFVDGIVNVNDSVAVHPIAGTHQWSSDTTDCPDGFVGKFSFDVEIKSRSDKPLSDLAIQIVALTGGNVLMVADGESGNGGTTLTVRKRVAIQMENWGRESLWWYRLTSV